MCSGPQALVTWSQAALEKKKSIEMALSGGRQNLLCAFLQSSLVMALVLLRHLRDGSEGPEEEAVEPGCKSSGGNGQK